MRTLSDSPAPAGVLFPELLGPADPAPPAHSRGSRVLRVVARILLWSLIVAGALRGLLAAPDGSGPVASPDPPDDRLAAAVATAFLREYLTIGDDRAARAERLGRFTVAGLDLRRSVSIPDGVAQYADLVVAAGGRPVAGGVEVTVLAHVLQVRSGVYHDAGNLAFIVPLAVRPDGVAVAGRPRPAALPVASRAPLSPTRPAPAELSPEAGRVARRAVDALAAGDTATLTRLMRGPVPPPRPLPSGWRVLSVGTAEAAGAPGEVTARVPVRVQPPAGQASYLVSAHVRLDAGPRGISVRRLDLGGSP
jgi:hypothetical protein